MFEDFNAKYDDFCWFIPNGRISVEIWWKEWAPVSETSPA